MFPKLFRYVSLKNHLDLFLYTRVQCAGFSWLKISVRGVSPPVGLGKSQRKLRGITSFKENPRNLGKIQRKHRGISGKLKGGNSEKSKFCIKLRISRT